MKLFIVILILVIVTYIIVVLRNKKTGAGKISLVKKTSEPEDITSNSFPSIQIVENASLTPLEKNKIVDEDVKNAIISLDSHGTKAAMIGENLKIASELTKKDKAFFSATKKGTENMLGVKNSNKVYGMQMDGNKFEKQRKFLKEEQLIKTTTKNAVVNAGFNAASMVVGQYYMSEINDKLENIQQNIQGVSSDLDSEYQGKLSHLISKIKEILDNQKEILNNDFSRDKRYNEISREEASCTTLLGHANSKIADCIVKENLDYKNYIASMKEVEKWLTRQQILLKLLLEIGNLRYVLAYGNETSIFTHTQYNNYVLQTNNLNERLENWHNIYCEKFGIDKEEHKRKSNLYTLKKNTIGRIKEEWSFDKLDEIVESLIEAQTSVEKMVPYIDNKQDEKITILKHNGEYYNFPEYKSK